MLKHESYVPLPEIHFEKFEIEQTCAMKQPHFRNLGRGLQTLFNASELLTEPYGLHQILGRYIAALNAKGWGELRMDEVENLSTCHDSYIFIFLLPLIYLFLNNLE